MKRPSSVVAAAAPSKLCFEEIPEDVWFAVATNVKSFVALGNMSRTCKLFRCIIHSMQKEITSSIEFDRVCGSYSRTPNAVDWRWPTSRAMLMWEKSCRTEEEVSVAKAMTTAVRYFLKWQSCIVFRMWDYTICINTMSASTSSGLAGKSCALISDDAVSRAAASRNRCYCAEHINTTLKNTLKRKLKDYLVEGLGCTHRMDIYHILPTVELIAAALDHIRCGACRGIRASGDDLFRAYTSPLNATNIYLTVK